MSVKITAAETAGFCFGVARAVDCVEKLISAGSHVCTFGPLIHNPGFIKHLEEKGVYAVNSVEDIPDGATAVLRAHGVPRQIQAEIEAKAAHVVDGTCPFVKKIHRIVDSRSADGAAVIIAGDPTHPEVLGIKSYAKTEAFVINGADALKKLATEHGELVQKPVCMVSQTTFSAEEFKKCKEFAKKVYTNLEIFDTICNATALRQEEASRLSAKNDMMIVIGGKNSSNTKKLWELCSRHCPTYLIEDVTELSEIKLSGVRSIGVTAGASTPSGTIKEVLTTMAEITENISTAAETAGQAEAAVTSEDMSFEQALEESLNSMNNDQKVVGTVMRIAPNEIQVDIGRKQTGYIPIDEYSADPTADPAKELKVGDELNLIIMKTNDAEGTIMLSKRL